MTSRFYTCLPVVTAVHVGLIVAMMFIPVWERLFRRQSDMTIPIEFMVDVTQLSRAQAAAATAADSMPTIARIPPKKKFKAKPPPKEPVSAAKAVPLPDPVPPKSNPTAGKRQLTEKEILEMLRLGAKPSNVNVIPQGDAFYRAIIQAACYDTWIQPTYEASRGLVAEVSLRFDLDGNIVSAELLRKTGVPAMDDSVMAAVRSLRRIDGLSPDWLRGEKFEVTLAFRVTPQ